MYSAQGPATYGITAGIIVSIPLCSSSGYGAKTRKLPTCNRLCGTAFAGRDHDQEFHNTVIDLVASALDNVDILVTHGGANAHARLAIAELSQLSFRGDGTQALTNSFSEDGVGCPAENLDASHCGSLFESAITIKLSRTLDGRKLGQAGKQSGERK